MKIITGDIHRDMKYQMFYIVIYEILSFVFLIINQPNVLVSLLKNKAYSCR